MKRLVLFDMPKIKNSKLNKNISEIKLDSQTINILIKAKR